MTLMRPIGNDTMNADPATHTDHEIGAEAVIARQRAEIERLRTVLEQIRELETLEDGKLSTSGEIADAALAVMPFIDERLEDCGQ
jgi:hypothetical protein